MNVTNLCVLQPTYFQLPLPSLDFKADEVLNTSARLISNSLASQASLQLFIVSDQTSPRTGIIRFSVIPCRPVLSIVTNVVITNNGIFKIKYSKTLIWNSVLFLLPTINADWSKNNTIPQGLCINRWIRIQMVHHIRKAFKF